MNYAKLFILLITFSVFAQGEIDKAEKLFDQKKYSEATTLLEKFSKEYPNNLVATELLGDIAIQQKKWDEAIKYYSLLKKSHPTVANYHYKYGGALGLKAKEINKFKALKLIDDIENAFLKASQLDTKDLNSRWALIMFYIELPGIVGGSEKKAQKYADEIALLSKADGYLAKAYIEEYFNRIVKAETYYLKAYQLEKSKKTFQKLYNFYLYKSKEENKAKKIKEQFEK